MEKIKEKILQTNFPKFWKRFLTLSLVLVLLGGIGVGLSFRTQISEGITYIEQVRQEADSLEADRRQTGAESHSQEQDGEHDHWKKEILENAPITEPSLGAKLLLGGYALLCCVIFAVYWLAVAVWLYRAGALAHLYGPLWLLAGLCGNLLAVALFLLLRSIFRKKCPDCGSWLGHKARFCIHCGKSFYTRCPSCGKECGQEEKFCSACGHAVLEEKDGENT